MRYHGNYCGPNWSDGKIQESICGFTPPIDLLDQSCKDHDCSYFLGNDKTVADFTFAADNLGFVAPKRLIAGVGVGIQGVARAVDRVQSTYKLYPTMSKRLRGTNAFKKAQNTNGKQNPRLRGGGGNASQEGLVRVAPSNSDRSMVSRGAPVAIGTTVMSTKPRVRATPGGVVAIGRDFGGNVYSASATTYNCAASLPVNPAFFIAGVIGNLSRTYERYRFKHFRVSYLPAMPTSDSGQIVMTSSKSIKEPFLNGAADTFIGRALAQGNAAIGPIWQPLSLDVVCDGGFRVCDLLVDGDLDDSIAEEVQVYTSTLTTKIVGALVVDYEIEFLDPLYQPHAQWLPVWTGTFSRNAFVDDGAVNATTDVVLLTNATVAATSLTGEIYRAVFMQIPSTLPTGPVSWGAVWTVATQSATTTTTTSTTVVNVPGVDGSTFYMLNRNDSFILYSSLENAIVGGINGAICYQTATTVAGTYYLMITLVRIPPASLTTVQ